jgi:hypothetical protein
MFEELGISYSGRKLNREYFPHPCFLLTFNPISASAQKGISENFEDSALVEDGNERDIKIKTIPTETYSAKPMIEYPAAQARRLGETGSGSSPIVKPSEGIANFLALPNDPNSQLVETGLGTYYYKEK